MPEHNRLESYADFVTQLASERSMRDFESKLGTGGLGLAGEAGEVADLTKKILFHGMEWNEDVRQKLKKEMGDVLWYAAFVIRNVLGMTFEEVLDANEQKLLERYKGGVFSTAEFMAKESQKKE